MSHLFISYKRQDSEYRDLLIEGLKNYNIPFWVDINIDAGDEWRDSIDEALDSCFAVAVLLTPRSVVSPYVTYEWARALGNGKPVIPLVFETIDINQRHARLGEIQEINCQHGIPETVYNEIRDKQEKEIQLDYSEKAIVRLFLPIWYDVVILKWLYEYSKDVETHPYTPVYRNKKAILSYRILDINKNLSDFWMKEANNLNRRLRKELKTLSSYFNGFINLLSQAGNDSQLYEYWTKNLEPILVGFLGSFDTYLLEFKNSLYKTTNDEHEIRNQKNRVQFQFMSLIFWDMRLTQQENDIIKSTLEHVFSATAPLVIEDEDFGFDTDDEDFQNYFDDR